MDDHQKEVAVFGGGCFWCLEAVFGHVNGVASVTSGYMGGAGAAPTYEEVCTGRTGHAEVVSVEFDPTIVSFAQLLDVFFGIHDPTTPDRQGNDVGSQYRSVVFYRSPEQKQAVEAAIARLEKEHVWADPIVTQVVPAQSFHPAEACHQEYFVRNPYQPYCQFVVAPKVAKFRSQFLRELKKAR